MNLCSKDPSDPSNDKDNIKVRVKVGKYGIYIHADGYGEKTAPDGKGEPILIELHQGSLKVYVWGDINEEDPTHIINMDDARESNRNGEE